MHALSNTLTCFAALCVQASLAWASECVNHSLICRCFTRYGAIWWLQRDSRDDYGYLRVEGTAAGQTMRCLTVLWELVWYALSVSPVLLRPKAAAHAILLQVPFSDQVALSHRQCRSKGWWGKCKFSSSTTLQHIRFKAQNVTEIGLISIFDTWNVSSSHRVWDWLSASIAQHVKCKWNF